MSKGPPASAQERVVWCTRGGHLYHHRPYTCFNAFDRKGMPLELFALWESEAEALGREYCWSCEPNDGKGHHIRDELTSARQVQGREEIAARDGKKPPVRKARRTHERPHRPYR